MEICYCIVSFARNSNYNVSRNVERKGRTKMTVQDKVFIIIHRLFSKTDAQNKDQIVRRVAYKRPYSTSETAEAGMVFDYITGQ
ncbi:hypothetical protein M9458_052739, partial [Cirrhinus mrigala]